MTETDLGLKLDRLALAMESLNERTDTRHEGVVSQLHSMHANLEGVRTAQEQHGVAIARIEATLAARDVAYGATFADLRYRQQKQSNEIGKLGGEVVEVSQVTAIADIKRTELTRTASKVWAIAWKVLLVAGTLGLLGQGVAEIVRLLK